MSYYLFSNVLGSYLLDTQFKIVDSIKAEHAEFDIWLDAELQLIDKHKGKDIVLVGSKEEKKLKEDLTVVKYILKNFQFKNFKESVTKLTKLKIKQSVNEDNFIIQAVNNIDEINKAANLLSKRLREWYGLYNPEFTESIESHEKFSELIVNTSKEDLLKEMKIEFSMGADLEEKDLEPIMYLAKQVKELYRMREKHILYLEEIMKLYCRNILAITGAMIGAKLLAQAGSLRRLALFPASTVQLLGAEKALFRHMKTKARPPKFGFLMSHPFVASARRENKGKVARALANKISLAAKIDLNKGEFIGDKYRKMIEEKFK